MLGWPVAVAILLALFSTSTPEVQAQDRDAVVMQSGTMRIAVDPRTGEIQRLENLATRQSWQSKGAKVFHVEQKGLEAMLSITLSHEGEVELTLSLHNPGDRAVTTDVHFPQLEGLSGGDLSNLHYCYPRQGLIVGNKPIELEDTYSSRFPLQFVSAYQPGKSGVYAMTCDTDLLRKRYRLTKQEQLDMGACYPGLVVEPGQTLELPPARIGVYEGDWHHAFDAYRRWTAQWYKPASPRKQWFREVFNFRQIFLYHNLDTPGLFDTKAKTLSIRSSIEADRKHFGSIDYVHLFDWSQTPDQGRVGMYQPWHHLPREVLNQEVDKQQDAGMPVGLYFEGYLVSPAARIPNRPGRDWQLMNETLGRYDPFGSGDDYMCPGAEGWRDHLIESVKRIEKETTVRGFYIDQFGFGYQYPCYDPSHGHAIPSNQPRLEAKLIKRLREGLDEQHVLYTEQTPVDIAMQYQDGSFSYSMLHARNPLSPSRINLTRFAFPDFKTIQILKGDGPIDKDVHGVELVFYNGDGLWLVGPSDNPKWFSPEVLDAIRKTQNLRKTYLAAFTSEDVTPLVPTVAGNVYANRFRSEDHTVWTLLNAGDEPVESDVLRVRHTDGATYRDVWNERELRPVIKDGWAYLSLRLEAGAVGCFVMSRDSP